VGVDVAEVKEWKTQADLNVGDAPDWLSPFVAKYKDWNNFKREAQAAIARWHEQRDVGVDADVIDVLQSFPYYTATGGVTCKVVGVLDGTPELLVWIQDDNNQVPTLQWRAPRFEGDTFNLVMAERLIKTASGGAPIRNTLRADGAARLVYTGSEFIVLSPTDTGAADWGSALGFSSTELDASRLERLSRVNSGEDITATVSADARTWWPIGASMYIAKSQNSRFRVQSLTGLIFPGSVTDAEAGVGFEGRATLWALTRINFSFIELSLAHDMPIAGGP